MAGEDIRIANSVRQILGRHYIKMKGVRVMAMRGDVRVIGNLEYSEAKASRPVDNDDITKLKREIRRVKGVRNVAISIPSGEKQIRKEEEEKEEEGGEQKTEEE